ncbi:hypothetical protein Acife_0511 [Acidithiobacillus ferrivorans SS3]|uniref:Uncharacterized protein n=1 Tax=Acidithiobacillus ferrivorans SS3 TaxID=743299 RepID=G0JTW6_9PROT|nr:hypothetical protein [Acidithiobacillus ferrivorans]AEM46718.1 hypothetical protein Acife_0511 [Acidithiobacillus ferrivorans SS3]
MHAIARVPVFAVGVAGVVLMALIIEAVLAVSCWQAMHTHKK